MLESYNRDAPDFYRYQAKITHLDKQDYISASDVYDLLNLKRQIIELTPENNQRDILSLTIALDRWDRGNRVTMLEYIVLEGFESNPEEGMRTYHTRATFWLKCAEGLIREQLCNGNDMYDRAQQIMKDKKQQDPELYEALSAALAWNQALYDENSDVWILTKLYREYCRCRDELFGLDSI